MCFLSSFETIICHPCTNPCFFCLLLLMMFCFVFLLKSGLLWSYYPLTSSFLMLESISIIMISVNSSLFEINNQVQESPCPLHANLTVSNINPLYPSISYHNEMYTSFVTLITKPGENRNCSRFHFFITTKFLMLIQSQFFRIVFLYLNSSIYPAYRLWSILTSNSYFFFIFICFLSYICR